MGKYYYFVSQLPFLAFGQNCRISKEWFLEQAEKWLSARDFSIISRTGINDFYPRNEDNPVLAKYKSFELALREDIAAFRKNENRPVNSFNLNLSEGTPLEIERKLLNLRWKFIESLESGHFFDLEILLLYLLKIEILERLAIFDKNKGMAIFDNLCEVAG